MYELSEILNSYTEACIISFYLYSIHNGRLKFSKITIVISTIITALILMSLTLAECSPSVQLGITILMITVSSLIIYKESLWKKIYASALFAILILVSESVFIGILYMLNFGQPVQLLDDGIGRLIGMIGSKIICFWCCIYVKMFLKSKISEVSFRSWFAIIGVPLLSTVILNSIFISSKVSDKSNLSYILSVIGILLLNFFTFNYFEAYDKQIRLAVMEKVLEDEEKNYQLIESKYNELRRLKHDMKNQLKIAKEIFRSSRTEALEYLNELSDELSKTEGVCYTGISAVDAIINVKIQDAQMSGIKCITKIYTDNEINTDKITLCRILSNALDNAIEACGRCTVADREKFIYFILSSCGNNLYIHISNLSNEVETENLQTEKRNKLNHGIGIKSMTAAIEKMNGVMEVKYKNNIFMVDILLNR